MATSLNNIENVGLEVHLDTTKQNHNGYGYLEFTDMLERKVNRANLARIFGVDRKTIDRWIEVYNKEKTL
jgi:hypothetical protein